MSSDYQRVVEYLRDLRQAPLQAVTDEIATAAADYAALCTQANERLRKCSSFLQQGLRSEAIHLADESPNLLDLVAALDLPDPQTWIDFCQNNGLAVPPPLQLDRASQLNDAYSQDQPLEHLLSRHRLLALSRAPVRERLEVMRRISQLDQTNGAWEKDVRVFEKARLLELPTSFYNAVKNRDEASIAALMTELTANPWYEAIPVELSTAVSDAFARMQRATVEKELRKLLPTLRDAYAAQSVKECQALINRWKKIMDSHEVATIAPDLADEIKPVIAFVAEQEKREELLKRFRDSCKAFGKMLDRDAPDHELEAGYSKLKEFQEPIPEELTQRFADKRQTRLHAAERRHKLRLAGIGAAALVVVAVVLVAIVLYMKDAEAKKRADQINVANNAHSIQGLQQARQFIADIEKNHPAMLRYAQVAAAIGKTKALENEQTLDATNLTADIQQFANVTQSAKALAANPKATADQLLVGVSETQQSIDSSAAHGDLSWVDAGGKLAAASIEVRTLHDDLKKRASAAVREEIDQATAQIDPLPTTSVSETEGLLRQFSSRMTTLKNSTGLDDDARNAAAGLLAKIDQQQTALEALHGETVALDSVRLSSSPDDLAKALAAYIQKYPNDPRSPEFTQAIARLPLGKSLDAWRQLSAPWVNQMPPATADKAQKRIDAITAYLAANPESPIGMPAYTYMDYLRRAADALAEKGTWQLAFTDLVSNPMLSDLGVMKVLNKSKQTSQFYVLGDINLTKRTLGADTTWTFDAIDPNDLTKRVEITVSGQDKVASEKPERAPHAQVVSDIADDVKRVDDSNWDTWGIDLIERLRKNPAFDKDNEILVQAILIQQALKTEDTVAGWALGDTYLRAMNELARQQLDLRDFADPSRITDKTRKALRDIIAAIPSATEAKQTLAARKAALFKLLQFDVAAVGVALKDDAGHWTVSAPNGAAANGNILWTLAPGNGPATPPAPAAPPAPPPAGDATAPASTAPAVSTLPAPPANPGQLIQIGTVINGKFTLTDTTLRNIPQGSIVYITRP